MSDLTSTSVEHSRRQSDEPNWTVMVFMGADNLPDEADLSKVARDDIAEMRRVAEMRSVSPDGRLNTFVQLHGKGSVTREHVGSGEPFEVDGADRDATNGKALIAFMRWALKKAEHRERDHSLLVLWGHAYRFAIGYRAVEGRIDALDFAELQAVLRGFQEEHRKLYSLPQAPTLDIVAFDACELATIEMAYQLHPYAKYLLASQVGIPLPGWPYHRILDRLKNPKGRIMGPAELGTYIVRRYCEWYGADNQAVSLTMLDLKLAPDLFELTETLARKLAIAIGDDHDEQEMVSELFYRSRTIGESPKPFVDVADLCLNLALFCHDEAVTRAAGALSDFLISARPVVPQGSAQGLGRPFVVEHGRNAGRNARLNGVSLYAPHVAADAHDWAGASNQYEKFVFAQKTLWGDLVRALAQPS